MVVRRGRRARDKKKIDIKKKKGRRVRELNATKFLPRPFGWPASPKLGHFHTLSSKTIALTTSNVATSF
jgi:hypothetical protein